MSRLQAIASLLLRLDRRSKASLQEQLCQGLRQAISTGVLAPGTRLPSTRQLASELAVSRTTVVASLLQLLEEGYLTARERSGTFVAEDAGRLAAAPAGGRPRASSDSPLRLSRRMTELERAWTEGVLPAPGARPRAFRLSRPALDHFPVRDWSRILSRRAARISYAQLDYGEEAPELRSAIAQLVSSSRGMRVHADQVLLFTGSQRALEFAVGAVLDRGDKAWMEDPGYAGARGVLRAAGASIISVPVDDQGLVVAEGVARAKDARLAFTTPSCQFPLGVTMSLSRRQELLRWADAANACIVEDDYDCEFRYTGAPLAALHGLDASHRVLYVNSFSRTMFPALRLGYLVAPERLAERLRRARATLEEPLPSLVQLALVDFIAEGHFVRHLRKMKVLYRQRRDALLSAASAAGLHRLKVRRVESGLHAIAELPEGVDAEAVCVAAARRGVEVLPLSRFSADARSAPAALVLGFGAVDPERARDGMTGLVAAIDEVARTAR
ncbi:PLP-dependent aminotransferase family protein [Pyxidicoccus sp. 3LFB2]